jgi:hypothetical protein
MYPQESGTSTPCLWFGRHRGKPLSEVDTSYLKWALATVKLSSGTRRAVEAELASRGLTPPASPPKAWAAWMGPCSRCRCAEIAYRWLQQRNGRRVVSAKCSRCGAWLGTAPSARPYTDEADAAASATPELDVLVQLQDLGVELESDGATVLFRPGDYGRIPPELHQRIRECRHRLATLIGDTTRGT